MSGGAQLAVVVPTFNESANIPLVVSRLATALAGVAWEVVFVDDDSPDGTAAVVRALAAQDARVRLVQRVGRRGLAGACIEGMLATTAPYVAVMDADLQHDADLLPDMLHTLQAQALDIVVGSRHVAGGSLGAWSEDRQLASRVAARLSQLVLKADLKDPMSGFFMLRRELIDEVVRDLSGIGFKILLDIFISAKRPLRFKELPYTFGVRIAGSSKLDAMVATEYILMLLDKTLGRYVPTRFIPFAFIGGLGVFVHMGVLWALFRGLEASFVAGQTAATLVAMTFNFFLNNLFTYRDRRLRGWGLLRGWLSFTLACSVGAVANVGIATYLFHAAPSGGLWWIISATAGIIVGAVWNYAVTAVYTWSPGSATSAR
ncbi:glycosyltransferase family 2 protein [uncultured Thiohalocapsa sp.]|uniref:glycosyltransferase n=1 Tax=uncultured Thiohalocapsa sp. TaxID=768990 RepID=UPI0025EF804D|nr:glycosyltransferase family 2 protein [uncultured Thiohalocapsa sp.]